MSLLSNIAASLTRTRSSPSLLSLPPSPGKTPCGSSSAAISPGIQHLPFGKWYKYSYLGFVMHDRYSTYERFNTKAFTVVSPGKNEVMLADVDAVIEVLGKYKK